MALEGVKFDAFISYRHCEMDSFVSEQLHKKLEEFKLPKSVIKKHGLDRSGISRVFRDEAELPLSENLSDPISTALNNSEFLIVICTPRLSESLWCKKEVETFVATHDRKHVLLVLAEGEPDESFPEILMYEERILKDENGNDVKVRTEREPLAADCRGQNKKEILKALDNVVLRLCAAIFGLNYDDLKQRHRERQLRRRRIAVAAVMAVVTVFALTCFFFMLSIRKRNLIIQDKYAGAMATASKELLARGLRMDALYAARGVLPDHEKDGYNSEAYRALVNALAPYEIESSFFPVSNFPITADTGGFILSPDASRAVLLERQDSVLIDTATGKELCRVQGSWAQLMGQTLLWVDEEGRLICTDLNTGTEQSLADSVQYMEVAPGQDVALVFTEDAVLGLNGNNEFFSHSYNDIGITEKDVFVGSMVYSDDGNHAAIALNGFFNSWIIQLDLSDGRIEMFLEVEPVDNSVYATDGKTFYYYYENLDPLDPEAMTGVIDVYDVASGKMILQKDVQGSGFYRMVMGDESLILVSDRLAYLMDNELSFLNSISGYSDAVAIFPYDAGYALIDSAGDLYYGDPSTNYNMSWKIYGHGDKARVSYADYIDGRLYIKYKDNRCVVVYEELDELPAPLADSEIPDAAYDWLGEEVPEEEMEKLGKKKDIAVFTAAKSDDGKYTVVDSLDDILYVFDAEGNPVREVYELNALVGGGRFPWLESAQVYCLERSLYDKDFRRITDLPTCRLWAVGEDGKSLIVSSTFEDEYFRITILSYEEMLERADALLGDYVPNKAILEKYSME